MTTATTNDILTKCGIQVYDGMKVFWPQCKETERLALSSSKPMTYDCNNSVVTWVTDRSEVFVGFYTRKLMNAIKEAGYRHESQYVPFSNWDYPLEKKTEWENLWEEAKVQREIEFKEDCIAYSDKHGIGELPEEFLSKCFALPRHGLEVEYFYGEKSFQRSACDAASFDCTIPDQLGRVDYNNGLTSFVYRDGTQYVLKGYWLDELRKAGYTKTGLWVPFSNGEFPADPTLKKHWEDLPRKAS